MVKLHFFSYNSYILLSFWHFLTFIHFANIFQAYKDCSLRLSWGYLLRFWITRVGSVANACIYLSGGWNVLSQICAWKDKFFFRNYFIFEKSWLKKVYVSGWWIKIFTIIDQHLKTIYKSSTQLNSHSFPPSKFLITVKVITEIRLIAVPPSHFV